MSVATAVFFEEKHLIKRNNKVSFFAVFFIGLPLLVVSAIRYGIGTDYFSYYNIFQRIKYNIPTDTEPLYYLLNKLVAVTFGEFQVVVAICSAMFMFFVLSEVLRQSKMIPLSIFLIVGSLQYFFSLTNIRQQVGISILFFSLRYVESENFKKFVVCVIAATLFHTSCAVFVIVYFIKKIQLSPMQGFTITAAILVLRAPIAVFMRWFISYTTFASYLGSSKWDIGETSIATIAIQGFVLIFAVVYKNRKDEFYNYKLNMQYICLWITLFIGILPQMNRLWRNFGFIGALLIPCALASVKNKKQRAFLTFLIIIFYFVYANISIGLNDQTNSLPYQTIFSMY